ncbi:hypothetical protein L228DRAFT_89155 [Xylona heveae TC161]|uniref:Uncharacterized protein n=1 Tax=Xylona heveae (strain CBS 132557 / TC161) TaxID=1328760 RepID=A0A161TDY4_XYLHT|nr:hypothetical protein L228DRAFT_89155 [Xylona heveae TC161]KZF24097.1 hypothetical protein L228DRAFT_89155 [Xylona heveae TC161]
MEEAKPKMRRWSSGSAVWKGRVLRKVLWLERQSISGEESDGNSDGGQLMLRVLYYGTRLACLLFPLYSLHPRPKMPGQLINIDTPKIMSFPTYTLSSSSTTSPTCASSLSTFSIFSPSDLNTNSVKLDRMTQHPSNGSCRCQGTCVMSEIRGTCGFVVFSSTCSHIQV